MSSNKKYDSGRRSYTNGPANGHSSNKVKPRSNKPVALEGVYGNPRFSHAVTSLIGCCVQVEVQNGGVYEGIFLTFSPNMEIVLQMAHRVEEKNADGPRDKDDLIPAIIFKTHDIVSINALNVDLDYASKDSFTDSAISSKHNGECLGRELERWDADGPGADMSLESDVNGWAVEDMFKTNAEKYNVKTTYDSEMSAYTTALEVDESAEGLAKQARAERLAREIEQTDSYRHRVDLENQDDGENISAVPRESASPRDSSAPNRYIPPHQRKSGAPPVNRGTANSKPVSMNGVGPCAENVNPAQQTAPSLVSHSRLPDMEVQPQSELDKNKKNVMLSTKSDVPSIQQNSSPGTSPSIPPSPAIPPSNSAFSSPATASNDPEQSVDVHRPLQQSKSDHSTLNERTDAVSSVASSHHSRPTRQQKSEHKKLDRDEEVQQLKNFSDKFNLSDEKRPEPKVRPVSETVETSSDDKPPISQKSEQPKESPAPEESPDKKKFTLNPNAREFKPHTPPFVQNATSPRPQTQSPVVPQAISLHQPVFNYVATHIPSMMAPPADQQGISKRAVVSVVRPDLGQHAQALAATGPPLQAQPAAGMPGAPQYSALQPFMMQPAQGVTHYPPGQTPMYSQQIVPLNNNGPRLVSTQMGAPMNQMAQYPHHHHQQMGQIATVNMQQQQQLFIPGPGGISQPQTGPQMMPPNQNHHHHPPHYVPQHSRSTPPQQTSHPSAQQQQQAQTPTAQGQPTQHPPQQISYHPNGQIPPVNQPPLQPSPHTPASPQAQQSVMPMTYLSQPPVPTHTQNPAMHQMATNYMQLTPQVTYTAHSTHGPPPQNSVMMIQHPPQQMQGHLQHGPPQLAPAQMQGPVHMSQSAHPIAAHQMGPMHPSQIHYATQPSPR